METKARKQSTKDGKQYSSLSDFKRDYFPDLTKREQEQALESDPQAAGKAAASEIVRKAGVLEMSHIIG
jgi:hypothetical protein